MIHMAATEARADFSETLNRVAYSGDRIVLCRHDKEVAVLIPVEDLELLRAIEDRVDLEAARESLAEGGRVSWDDLKAEMGL